MAELLIQYKVLYISFKSLFQQSCIAINSAYEKRGKQSKLFAKHGAAAIHTELVEDPAKPEDLVKDWMWMLGAIITVVVAMIIGQLQWVSISPSFFIAWLIIRRE